MDALIDEHYPCDKYNNWERINEDLTRFMYRKPDVVNVPKETPIEKPVYIHSNSLFWCFFETIVEFHKSGRIELDEKQKITDYLMKNPSVFKQTPYKITNVLAQSLMSDVQTPENKLKNPFWMVLVYCIYFRKSVYVLWGANNEPDDNKTYSYFSYMNEKDENPIYLTYHINDRRFTKEGKTEELDRRLQIYSLETPIKGIGSYKVAELRDIAQILGIPVVDKQTKQTIYNNISEWMHFHIQNINNG
jgi:hypothetical protein